jgi:hypothetical protein
MWKMGPRLRGGSSFCETFRAELLPMAPLAAVTAGRRQPMQLAYTVVGLEETAGPTAECRSLELARIDSGANRHSLDQMVVGMAV